MTATVQQLRPQGAPNRASVSVGFGPNSQEFEIDPGATVGSIVDNAAIKDVIGFSGKENVVVNGQTVGRDHRLNPGDRVELIRQAGEKA